MHLRRNVDFNTLWNELEDCYNSLCIRCLAFKKDEEIIADRITVLLSRRGYR